MKYLCDVLDKKNFNKLINAFGGNRIWIPKNGNLGHRSSTYYAGRNNEIIYLRKNGKSIRKLAEKYSLSVKRIYTIIKAGKKRKN